MKNILITGGAGFVGSQVVKELAKKGKNTIVLDNFSVGLKTSIEKTATKIYEGNILDTQLVNTIITDNKVEAIIHLAALHYIPYCNEHVDEVMNTNVNGTSSILSATKGTGVKRFLFASSAAVYKPKLGPHIEEDTVEPVDIYGASKKMGEDLIKSFCKIYGIDFTIMRLFNVCGRGDLTPHLIPEIIKQAKTCDTVTLGNLDTKRDYIRKEDVACAFVTALANKNSFNETFNVGTGKSISVSDVFDMLNKSSQNKFKLKTVSFKKRKNDRKDLVANSDKLKTKLNWKVRHDLSEYISKSLH